MIPISTYIDKLVIITVTITKKSIAPASEADYSPEAGARFIVSKRRQSLSLRIQNKQP